MRSDEPEARIRKRRLREAISRRRAGGPPDPESARAAGGLVASLPEFERAGCIALYAALADELSTRPLFDRARARGKRCLLPRMREPRALDFHEVTDWEELRRGRYGVPEPRARGGPIPLSQAGLVVVPGVAFDRRGGRLGRGQGYYDRALAEARRAETGAGHAPFVVGLARSEQLLDEVPLEEHDQVMNAVVTEREIVRVASGGASPGRSGEPPRT